MNAFITLFAPLIVVPGILIVIVSFMESFLETLMGIFQGIEK